MKKADKFFVRWFKMRRYSVSVAVSVAYTLVVITGSVGTGEEIETRRWRVMELEFISNRDHANAMEIEVTASFTGPEGRRFEVPAFWDGERSWKVRFTPTIAGEWTYVTSCSDVDDTGLHGQQGSFGALLETGDNPLFKHGGFLQVSDNRRFLTYSDGTPFFWLGDTWWFCPSRLCRIEGSSNPRYASMFKTLVDTRKEQGFTVAQMAFLGPSDIFVSHFNPKEWTEQNIQYWRSVDQYITYANEAGIVPVIGIGFHEVIDKPNLEDLKERYVIGRYGAFGVTWLIAGEYNLDNVADRVEKVLALGQFIKDVDPYKRAMTVHPWSYRGDKKQAWDQPWYDFIMIQCGHMNDVPPVDLYRDTYRRKETKPLVEAECNYEGINDMTADKVRLVAYRAIQSGSFGYTYGAHGLWYPTQSAEDRRFDHYGNPLPWWEALAQPGGGQMRYLRTIYESVNWWNLEPRPQAVVTHELLPEEKRILTKAEADTVFVIYFPRGLDPEIEATLGIGATDATYSATWFNPRNGESTNYLGKVQMSNEQILLPTRPDDGDWILIVRKESK